MLLVLQQRSPKLQTVQFVSQKATCNDWKYVAENEAAKHYIAVWEIEINKSVARRFKQVEE